jgi:hypothetical protein
MTTFTPDDIADMVSVGDIARANGHSRMAVSKALLRFKIKPLLDQPYRLFHPGVISELRERMRKARARRL